MLSVNNLKYMLKNLLPVIVIIALVAAIFYFVSPNKSSSSNSVADSVLKSGTVRIGYVVYPPFLIKDANSGQLSGVSYDLIEQAAKNLNLKTNWAEEVGWGSMIEGLRTKRYDIIGTFIWPNSARSREASFSKPLFYSVVYPYAKSSDTRFDNNLSGLNSPSVTLATIDGEMTSFIAKADYPQAKTYSLPQLSSVSEALVGVTSGKADVTFVEPAIANDYLANNPGSIRKVGNTSVRTFANVLAVARGENDLLGMFNTALEELQFDGSVKRAVAKYNATSSVLPPQYPVGSNW